DIRDRNVTGVQTCALPISLEDITDIAKTSEKNYNKVELDEVVAHGYDKNGTLKERWVIPKGYNSIDEFLESVDDVSIKSFGYDRSEERRVGKECRSR